MRSPRIASLAVLMGMMLFATGWGEVAPPEAAVAPQHIWIEAEDLGPLSGSNFSFFKPDRQTKGSWALSGPGVADAWTQGGESEFLSIAIRADEPAGTTAGRDFEVPVAGQYVLWVRYADYRHAREEFGVRIRQGGKDLEYRFGNAPVVDELDPMKLYWDWAFGWDHAAVPLQKGAARLEVYSTGPTEARREIDCFCLTTDASYHPTGRHKPDFAAWQTLRGVQMFPSAAAGMLVQSQGMAARPAWEWNVGAPWLDQLAQPAAERIEAPFSVDGPLLPAFTAAFRGQEPPVYSHALSGPTLRINDYPAAFKTGSQFMAWLDRHPAAQFSILLNYGEPQWPAGTTEADKQAAYANLQRYGDRFLGYIAGENIAYAEPDRKALEARVRAAQSRADVLAALHESYDAAVAAKFSGYYGQPVAPAAAWAKVISCPSVGMEANVHALAHRGERRLGHESSGNNPTLALKLAFLRGAARQFGVGLCDYQSMNLGDAATMFSREAFFYPASSRYILDNQYDAWAGAGINWFLKDYLLWHAAGVDAFYNEQGVDIYWKPGGNSAGDDFPVGLSPKGRVAEAVQQVVAAHPRGPQFTPAAFLLDEAHGWAQEQFTPGAFGLDPQWNPKVLSRGRHDASIRGWLDVAYYPAPETLNDPASGIRQTYVNGVFGDIFDVIVATPAKAEVLKGYRTVILAGSVTLPADWGAALRSWIEAGGTLVVCAGQVNGAGAAALGLPETGTAPAPLREASSFQWGDQKIDGNVFGYANWAASRIDQVLATAPDGSPICLERSLGKGRLLCLAVPLGLGLDDRPTPLSGLMLRKASADLLPITVEGDVEWALNRLPEGRWLLTIFNNSGILKPQHGVVPTDESQSRTVTVRSGFAVKRSEEWIAGAALDWSSREERSEARLTIPAGAVRMIEIQP